MMKPVVFVPGFPASELRDTHGETIYPPSPGVLLDPARKQAFITALTNVPGNLVAGPPIRSVLGIAKQAQSLYDILTRLGYTIESHGPSSNFAPVGWDWRLGVDAKPTLDAVAAAVQHFPAPQKVVIIAHSTGALVLRAFLEAHPELAGRIEQVLAFGGAWCGTLEALHAIHAGESQSFLGITLLSSEESAEIIGHSQAAYDLLPPDPQRTEMDTVLLVHGLDGSVAGPNVDRSWIRSDRPWAVQLAKEANRGLGFRTPDFGPLPLTNVVGWGGPTWPAAILHPQEVTFLPPDKDAGDGTVPFVSASWIRGPHVRTIVIPIGAFAADPIPDLHAHMWDSQAVQQLFREVLQGQARRELIAAAADSDEAIDYDSDFVTVRMTAQTRDGKPLPHCSATAKIGGATIDIPFTNTTRGILKVSRTGIHHNAGNDIYRFTIDFRWDGGGHRSVVVTFRVP
jgi:pimeloyl-ACP methyl ester carboxylesterase